MGGYPPYPPVICGNFPPYRGNFPQILTRFSSIPEHDLLHTGISGEIPIIISNSGELLIINRVLTSKHPFTLNSNGPAIMNFHGGFTTTPMNSCGTGGLQGPLAHKTILAGWLRGNRPLRGLPPKTPIYMSTCCERADVSTNKCNLVL